MRPTTRTLATLATLSLLFGACGTQDPPAGVEPGVEADGAFDGAEDGAAGDENDGLDGDTGSAATDEGIALTAAVDAAVADLAGSEDLEEGAIEVVTAEEVTWPDGSLGCPEPDEMATQALVPGYRVVLAIDGDEVHYHGDRGQLPRRCDDPVAPVEDGA